MKTDKTSVPLCLREESDSGRSDRGLSQRREGTELGPLQELITWHDINESLPEDREDKLIQYGAGAIAIAFYRDRHWHDMEAFYSRVTHWAEMPVGPEVAS